MRAYPFTSVAALILGIAMGTSAVSQPQLASLDDHCGTSPATMERVRRLAERMKQRRPRMATNATAPIQLAQGVVLIPTDEEIAPFSHLYDLGNATLTFFPETAETYRVTRGELVYDVDRGTQLTLTGTPLHAAYRLPFDVPVFGTTLRDVHLSALNGIHGAPPSDLGFWQYDALEAIAAKTPLIAPFLTTPHLQSIRPDIVGVPEVYVRETESSVTITWATNRSDIADYDVRAKLFRDGTIQFSYVHLPEQTRIQDSAAIVITSGQESWRAESASLGTATDPAGDVSGAIPPNVAPMLDVTNARVERVAGLDLLRFVIEFAATPDVTAPGSGDGFRYQLALKRGGSRQIINMRLFPNGNLTSSLSRAIQEGYENRTAAMRIEGRTLIIEVTDDLLNFVLDGFDFRTTRVSGSATVSADQASVPVVFAPPQAAISTDFSALPAGGTSRRIVLEAFARPTLNVDAVWSRLQESLGWKDSDVDAVYIRSTFSTDLRFYAGAFATVGNPQVSGIGFPADDIPLPNLMHMGEIFGGYLDNTENRNDLHEFGHRWLSFVSHLGDDGSPRNDLNPDGAHPAQWVDTPAAFRVVNEHDSSTMGGGRFLPNPDGSFTTPRISSQGLSWLDLYLMGLAAPEEVAPIPWIDESAPPLGRAYYPPSNLTVTGTKREVPLSAIVAREGPRIPAYPATERRFTLVHILVTDPEHPATEAAIAKMVARRSALIANFRTATGGRAEIAPFPSPAARRRSARH
ncbi:MAG TPA: hypothetical protein VGQ76_20290 [Thermoanaerobaculia bacterium]|nr:hypothetical protein [Thermoanaerobaculia bacterium]